MDVQKMRDMDLKELEILPGQMQEQMFRLRFQMSMGQTDPVKKLRELRKDRARALTILRERELQAGKDK